jgi:hypothetical protein
MDDVANRRRAPAFVSNFVGRFFSQRSLVRRGVQPHTWLDMLERTVRGDVQRVRRLLYRSPTPSSQWNQETNFPYFLALPIQQCSDFPVAAMNPSCRSCESPAAVPYCSGSRPPERKGVSYCILNSNASTAKTFRQQVLEQEIESLDTNLRLVDENAPATVLGVIYRSYNFDSPAVGMALGLKPPHVRQLCWRLARTWERLQRTGNNRRLSDSA